MPQAGMCCDVGAWPLLAELDNCLGGMGYKQFGPMGR